MRLLYPIPKITQGGEWRDFCIKLDEVELVRSEEGGVGGMRNSECGIRNYAKAPRLER